MRIDSFTMSSSDPPAAVRHRAQVAEHLVRLRLDAADDDRHRRGIEPDLAGQVHGVPDANGLRIRADRRGRVGETGSRLLVMLRRLLCDFQRHYFSTARARPLLDRMPAAIHASMPPSSGRTRLKPCCTSTFASLAAVYSLGHAQYTIDFAFRLHREQVDAHVRRDRP